MIATRSIQDKVIWNGTVTPVLADSFYPSFYKDILKREAVFSKHFTPVFEDARMKNLEGLFLPLYRAEIMSRTDYTLDRGKIIKSIRERIRKNSSRYKFLFIFSKEGELFGATLFSFVGDKLQVAFRAYKRDVAISALKHKASLDYWGEKLLKEYAVKLGATILSHGRDSHPYIGRKRIGLALYKLKVGSRPRIPKMDNPEKPVHTIEIKESFLCSQHEPVVFFCSPDENGFYKESVFYYPSRSVHESFVNEYRVVCGWAGILLHTISIEGAGSVADITLDNAHRGI